MPLAKSKLKTLTEVTPTAFSVGDIAIFTQLEAYTDIPWQGMDIQQSLNRYYYGLHSGDKIISPLVEKLMVGDVLDLSEMEVMAKITHDIYIKKWFKLWAVREAEYNPINNYDMVENETVNDETEYGNTHTRTDNLNHTKTGYDMTTPNLTETETPNLTTDKTRGVYGFNSTQSSDSDVEGEHVTGTNARATTGTNRTDYNTTDTNTGTEITAQTGTDAKEVTRQLTRSGNIGVTTSQQMLQSEIALWQWDYFKDVVFPDIDKVITIQVY